MDINIYIKIVIMIPDAYLVRCIQAQAQTAYNVEEQTTTTEPKDTPPKQKVTKYMCKNEDLICIGMCIKQQHLH